VPGRLIETSPVESVSLYATTAGTFPLHGIPVYLQTAPTNSLHNIHYSLLLHASATGYGHFQGATNCTGVCSIYCERS